MATRIRSIIQNNRRCAVILVHDGCTFDVVARDKVAGTTRILHVNLSSNALALQLAREYVGTARQTT